jgi:hypothetical protein
MNLQWKACIAGMEINQGKADKKLTPHEIEHLITPQIKKVLANGNCLPRVFVRPIIIAIKHISTFSTISVNLAS